MLCFDYIVTYTYNSEQCTKGELIKKIQGLEHRVQTLMNMVQLLHSQVQSSGIQVANLFQQNKQERVNMIMVANDLAQENIGDRNHLLTMTTDDLAIIQQQVLQSYVKKLKQMDV